MEFRVFCERGLHASRRAAAKHSTACSEIDATTGWEQCKAEKLLPNLIPRDKVSSPRNSWVLI
jgi:hypothetical protein